MSGNAECVYLVAVPSGPITPFSKDTERAWASFVLWADSLELLTQSQDSGKPSSSSRSLALNTAGVSGILLNAVWTVLCGWANFPLG